MIELATPWVLTEREREVAALIGQGKSNGEMSRLLVVSKRTVGTYVSRVLSKFGLDVASTDCAVDPRQGVDLSRAVTRSHSSVKRHGIRLNGFSSPGDSGEEAPGVTAGGAGGVPGYIDSW